MLDENKKIPHNYANKRVERWLIENYVPDSKENGIGSFGCGCEIEEIWNNYSKKYVDYIVVNGESELYEHFFDVYPAEYLIEHIEELTEKDKEELEEIEQLHVYYCPYCHEWALNGDNI